MLLTDGSDCGCVQRWRSSVCRTAAYLSLAVPVYGQDTAIVIAQRCILWLFVVLILVTLFLCYRFELWKLCYDTGKKYSVVSGSEAPAPVPLLEELVVIPAESYTPSLTASVASDKIYPDVDIKDFVNKVRRMRMDSDHGFCEEFQDITKSTKCFTYSAEICYLEKNQTKNRYLNIPAFDHSRVILKVDDSRADQSDYINTSNVKGDDSSVNQPDYINTSNIKEDDSSGDQSDYINANYVNGYQKPQAYIATQGPLPNTVCDFWRMVWDQGSNIIVMITNLAEKGRSKCDQYWPTKGEEEYGNLTVRMMSTCQQAYYTTRVFLLTHGQPHSRGSTDARTVCQYHYTQWPDHGVPPNVLPVLSFVHKSATNRKPEGGPVIVHCSAGVGRTGCYILIDSMINQIADKQSVNIPGFLLDMRRQRHFMVQTEEQYKCVHEALVEYIQASGATEVSEEQLPDYLPLLEQPSKNLFMSYTLLEQPSKNLFMSYTLLEQPSKNLFMSYTLHTTLLEKQFQLITEYAAEKFELSVALDPCNESKNKPGSLLPVSCSRVVLPAKPGIAGSDYINATFLQGHTKVEEFVVTPHPTEQTVPDFWRMVWHVRSPVIVVLSDPREKENVQFWPSKNAAKSLDFDGFCIISKGEPTVNSTKNLTAVDVLIDFSEDLVTFLTRVIIVKDWPHGYRKLHRVFGAISAAQSFVTSLVCGPVIVVDRFGGVEAGTFCALWTLRDQLLSERCADFYQVCKLYHFKRPGIFVSQENYLFIHRALVAFYKHMQAHPVQKSVDNLYQNSPCDHMYINANYKQS